MSGGSRRVEDNLMKFAAAVVGALLIGAAPASAQNSIGDAVLGLWNGVADAPVQIVNGRIYGGTIEATVRNLDGVGASLGAGDQISAFRISRNGQFLEFPADLDPSRAAFNRWVNDNAGAILALLFPASVSESVTGRDAAQTYAQQFLLTTALDTTAVRRGSAMVRGTAAGLLEFEQIGIGENRALSLQLAEAAARLHRPIRHAQRVSTTEAGRRRDVR